MIRPVRVAAALAAFLALLVLPPYAQADFGIEPGSLATTFEISEGVAGVPQASSHPYAFSIGFRVNGAASGSPEGGEMRNILINLPPGFAGDPFAVTRCTRQEFEGTSPHCSPNSQVGIVHANLSGVAVSGPIYNMVPPAGVAAQLGFSAAGLNALQNISVQTDEGLDPEVGAERYGLGVDTLGLPLPVLGLEATIWGTPADSSHDDLRGQCNAAGSSGCVPIPFPGVHEAFLTLPAECSKPIRTTVEIDSNLEPQRYVSAAVESRDTGGSPAAPQGCDAVPFSPKISVSTASTASASSGLKFELGLPNQGLRTPGGIAETEPEKVEFELPAGITANASAASGLLACSEEQFKASSVTTAGCPESSKLGTLVAHSPVIDEPVEGSVYLATPLHNRFGTLLSLYIVATAKERGVLIKQAGRIDTDQSTGQLTTTFDGLPPLPYSSFQLNLREGPRGPLTTPLTCGTYQATARLYPFSEPAAVRTTTAPFMIRSGPEGGGCVGTEAQLPSSPKFEAGTQSPLAGMYSPFVMNLSRIEASQHFQALNVALPSGVAAKFAGVQECSEAQIAQAKGRSNLGEGALEIAHPSCPPGSELGTVTVGAGSGTPLYVQGHAYLAGPYKGAPFSIAIITPAVAGPFDLGTVMVRAALYVSESTAQGTIKSDSFPAILHGIPLDVRSVAVQVARKDFTLNPTSCETKHISAEAISTTGQVSNLQNRFQVGGCKGLDFQPHLKLFFSGQTKRTGYPAVRAVLTQPKGENANVAGATVILPKGMLIANAHINNPCTRVQFNSTGVPGQGCPTKSVLGTAKVWTPLLENPEEGNVYFRSNGGERQLPDMVVALHGKVPLQLLGFIDSVGKKNAEVRRVRSRFLNLPDAPVSRFELKLAGGKKGLLESSRNLCRGPDKASFKLAGQNGKTYDTEPKVQVRCGKHKKKSGKK